MPMYIDRHALATIPSAVQQRMHREAMRGSVDPHGVQPLGHWVTDRLIYCVLRAPSDEAVCRYHTERGLPCDELHPITGLRGSHPLSADETQLVRAALADLWPPIGCVAA